MYLSIEGFWAMKRVNFGGLSLVIASLFVLIMSFPASAKEVRNEVEFNSTKKLINYSEANRLETLLNKIRYSLCYMNKKYELEPG